MPEFKVHSEFEMTGDQPQAVEKIAKSIESGNRFQTLLGVTGSGKTYTMAKIIEKVQKPTLIISHNKTRRSDNWDAISPIFKFSGDVRTSFYTTNAVESLNSTLRRLNRRRSVFSGSQALLKALYLATFEATRKWTMPLRNRGKVRGELSIMYPECLPE